MKKILSLSVLCSFFLLIGQVSFASFVQDQETVEATESMQEMEQTVAEEPQSAGFTQELKIDLLREAQDSWVSYWRALS